MHSSFERSLFWTPRLLAIAFVAFLSVFALDVFDESATALTTLVSLAMHLIPSALVLLALWLAWNRERLGGLAFVALGVAYCVAMRGRFPLATYYVVAGPLFLIGALFLAHANAPRRVVK